MSYSKLTQFTSLSPFLFLVFIVAGTIAAVYIHDPVTVHTLRIAVLGGVLLFLSPLLLMWTTSKRMSMTCDLEGKVCSRFGLGPYRYSRHPKHVAFVLMIVGLGFVMNSWILLSAAFLSIVIFTLIIIPYEERVLLDQFPDEYRAYQKRTRMWI